MPRETYDRIVEHGILGPDDKVELLEGRLIVAEPKFSPHASGVLLVADALRRVFTDGWHVRTEMPLAMGPFSEPEPDVCVVIGAIRDYRAAHPGARRDPPRRRPPPLMPGPRLESLSRPA